MQGELEGRGAFDPREDITIGKLRLSKTVSSVDEGAGKPLSCLLGSARQINCACVGADA